MTKENHNEEYGIGDFLQTFKPSCLIVAFFINSTLWLVGVVVDGGINKPIKTLGGNIIFSMSGLLLLLYTSAPLVSIRIRKLVCNPETDFKQARIPLIFLAVIGAFFALGTGWTAFNIYSLRQ